MRNVHCALFDLRERFIQFFRGHADDNISLREFLACRGVLIQIGGDHEPAHALCEISDLFHARLRIFDHNGQVGVLNDESFLRNLSTAVEGILRAGYRRIMCKRGLCSWRLQDWWGGTTTAITKIT